MYVQQFFVRGLSHSSYLLGGSKTCAIIDPRRDVQIYIDAAEEMGLRITHILQTHLHADFVSGHMDLAERTGATIVVPASGGSKFEHMGVAEGDSFDIDHLKVSVLETPGHTPEHISYVVVDTSRGSEPASVFPGDTLFVGDVGRPDLFPGQAERLANSLYTSLHDKLLKLPDFCEVYPAHGAGSLCGRAMSAKRTSTIGYERLYNSALQVAEVDAFVHSLTHDMPGAPDHFSRCSAINGAGPATVNSLPRIVPLLPAAFAERMRQSDTIVVDLRGYEAFGGQHVPGAYHITAKGNLPTFAGWVLPPDKNILLVAESPADVHDGAIWLRRVGLDHIVGYLDGGMNAWANAGFEFSSVPQLSMSALTNLMGGQKSMVLLDTRGPSEFASSHIEGSINIPAPDLRTRHTELDPSLPVAVICNTGNRSSIGVSLLLRAGFTQVYNVAGGVTAFSAAGLAPECARCVAPHCPGFEGSAGRQNS